MLVQFKVGGGGGGNVTDKKFPPILKRARGITTRWDKQDASGEQRKNEIKNFHASNIEYKIALRRKIEGDAQDLYM